MSDSCAPRKIAMCITEFADKELSASVYVGVNAGDCIEKEIASAKDIKICSPTLKDNTLKILQERAKDNVKISLVTTTTEIDYTPYKSDNLQITVYDSRPPKTADEVPVQNPQSSQTDDDNYRNFPSDTLQLHAKFYIFDNTRLYLSSANYTVSGMKYNLETMLKITPNATNPENAKFIAQMSALFEKLLQNTGKFKVTENYHV